MSLAGLWTVVVFGMVGCEEAPPSEPRMVPISQVEVLVSDQLCARMYSCPCTVGTRYVTRAGCDAAAKRLANKLAAVPSDHPGRELTYDPECMGALIDSYAEIDCDTEIPVPVDENGQPECQGPCHLYYGTRREWQPCELEESYYTDCAQGLECVAGMCIDPCDPEFAGPSVGELCPSSFCAEGLFCGSEVVGDPTSDQRCFLKRPVGEPCEGHLQCQSGYCPNGFCNEGVSAGERCETEFCAAGLTCVELRCEPSEPVVCAAEVPTLP